MNRVRALSNSIPKSSNSYDGTYLSLLKETLRDELLNDTESTKMINDSTRAWLKSTWYRNPIKNENMEKNVLSLQSVTSHLETLRRKRDFKHVFYTLNLIKNTKIEWVTLPGKNIYRDESGIPEEFYFVLNKTMISITSGYLLFSDVVAIAKVSLSILKKYTNDINQEKPSISFLVRIMGLVCKAKSIFLLNEGLAIISENCKSLKKEEIDMIRHLSIIRFYQETDQRSKVAHYYRNYCHNAPFLPIFVVAFNLERLLEQFIVSSSENNACMVLKKYNDLGFRLRPDNLATFAALIEKNSLKKVNKTLLELYPEEYTPLNNTPCLNDDSDSGIECILKILESSEYNSNKHQLDLDFLLPKIPNVEHGVELYLHLEKLLLSQTTHEFKVLLVNLFVKKASGMSPSCFSFFLKELFSRDEMLSIFLDFTTLNNKGINLRSLLYISAGSPSSKISMLSLFNFLTQNSEMSSQLTAFDFSMALQSSLQGSNRTDFFYYFYHFMINHGSKYLKKENATSGFLFPTSVQDIFDSVHNDLGQDINSILESSRKAFSITAKSDHEIAQKIKQCFGGLYVDKLTSEQLIIREKETQFASEKRNTANYKLRHDLKLNEHVSLLLNRLKAYISKK